MSKKISMTFSERFGVRNLLNESYQKGGLTLDTLVNASKVSEKCAIEIDLDKPNENGVMVAKGGAEAKAVNLRQAVTRTPDGAVSAQLLWDTAKDKGKEIEFTSDEIKLMKEVINSKSERKEITLADFYLVGLLEKLNKEEKKAE